MRKSSLSSVNTENDNYVSQRLKRECQRKAGEAEIKETRSEVKDVLKSSNGAYEVQILNDFA